MESLRTIILSEWVDCPIDIVDAYVVPFLQQPRVSMDPGDALVTIVGETVKEISDDEYNEVTGKDRTQCTMFKDGMGYCKIDDGVFRFHTNSLTIIKEINNSAIIIGELIIYTFFDYLQDHVRVVFRDGMKQLYEIELTGYDGCFICCEGEHTDTYECRYTALSILSMVKRWCDDRIGSGKSGLCIPRFSEAELEHMKSMINDAQQKVRIEAICTLSKP